jgi:hypothetical protein
MIGDAALVFEFSYGSELRKDSAGDCGVRGVNCDCLYDDCDVCILVRSRRDFVGRYMEERADADSPAVEVDGLRGASLGAGEKLRLDAVWNDDIVEAESACVRIF